MTHIDYKSVLLRLGLALSIILLAVGFRYWTAFEEEKKDDVTTMNQLAQIRESLHLYFADHNQYPPLSDGRQSLTVSQTLHCLSDTGFLPLSSNACEARDYLIRFKGRYAPYDLLAPFVYEPIDADGTSCVRTRGCDGYAIPFELKTNALFAKGGHRMTDQGIQ